MKVDNIFEGMDKFITCFNEKIIIEKNNYEVNDYLLANLVMSLGFRNFIHSGEGIELAEELHVGRNAENARNEFSINLEKYSNLQNKLQKYKVVNDTFGELALYEQYFSKGMGSLQGMNMRINLSISNLIYTIIKEIRGSTNNQIRGEDLLTKLNQRLKSNQHKISIRISGRNFSFRELFGEFDEMVIKGLIDFTTSLSNELTQSNKKEKDYETLLIYSTLRHPRYYKGPVWDKIISILESEKDKLPGFVSLERIKDMPWDMNCKESEFFIANFNRSSGEKRELILDIDNLKSKPAFNDVYIRE